MKTLIAAVGFLLATNALAGGGNLLVQLSPAQQQVARGDTPHFVVMVVARDGPAVEVPVAISDPGPVDEKDYMELRPGESMTLANYGSPLALSKLPPGLYSVTVTLQPDWSGAPVQSNSVSFHVANHGS